MRKLDIGTYRHEIDKISNNIDPIHSSCDNTRDSDHYGSISELLQSRIDFFNFVRRLLVKVKMMARRLEMADSSRSNGKTCINKMIAKCLVC